MSAPSSITVRNAAPGDATGIARVHVASWRSTYPGIVPDQYLVNLSTPLYAERWRGMLAMGPRGGRETFVAVEPGGEILGFATCGPQRTAIEGYGGEFYALYLYDHAQGQGLGRRLMGAMAGDLLGRGVRSACVWVLRDNPARWFYERLGGMRLAEQPISFAGARLEEVCYGWRDLAPLARASAMRES
ncbi:MAG TPA: GNAT family N-acetyltransferase [Azospirillaceae bacterium]|nr:GNAT family N-acetyltransferase [Azospirillaceae bacterium]